MKKKKEEKVVEVVEVEEVEEKIGAEPVKVSAVGPLTAEFGRVDLNQMRDKINEIIARI